MEYRYSEIIDPNVYETHGLANGIALRGHKEPMKEIRGARRAQIDWSIHVKPLGDYKGGLGQRFSFMQVTVPECLPERLEIISYANEYAFIYDDEMESLDLENVSAASPEILETFKKGVLDSKTSSNSRPEKRLQAQILKEMIAIDPQRAITSMKAWARFVQLASQTRASPFRTLAEYVPARVIDAGELIWFGTLTFGMALTIPDEEYDLCMELARPGYAVLGLTNDLYSWEKERQTAEKAGQGYVFNAIWVIMNEQRVSEDEAKAICAEEIRHYATMFRRNVDETKDNMALSRDLRAYIEAVMYSCSGNLVWSIYCPRYNEV
ncbi:isoprenoid synthase domain-containing protein [Trichoderma chlorosporum]